MVNSLYDYYDKKYVAIIKKQLMPIIKAFQKLCSPKGIQSKYQLEYNYFGKMILSYRLFPSDDWIILADGIDEVKSKLHELGVM